MTNKTRIKNGFDDLGIRPSILGVLDKLDLSTPTPIQKKSIPVAMEGQDIIGIAQTGTGKTYAFGIPMLQRLPVVKGRSLILLPTRELAHQVEENLRKLGGPLGLRLSVLIGGESIGRQLQLLKKNPHVIIATPGRLIDHLKRKSVKLDDVKILILDEADLMFDIGFAPQIEEILSQVPKERQTMLFSATMPPAIIKLVNKHMKLPVRIEVAPAGTTAEQVDQEMYVMRKDDKDNQLEKILNDYKGTVLIFSRTKRGAKILASDIREMGHTATEIHSNLSTGQRRQALAGFKANKFRVLVATDIAARGIDVKGIELVVNYDLPENSEDYVHRIGRTGRAGNTGKAISFALPSQGKDIKKIERLINMNFNLTKFTELESSSKIRPKYSRFGRRTTFAQARTASSYRGGSRLANRK